MKLLLFIPAMLAFLCTVVFLYAVSIIAFPVLGVMFFTCPHAPFVMGWMIFKKILNGNIKTAFE